MKQVIAALSVLLLGACALPESKVKAGAPRPQLAVKGAPADALLVIDGLSMGPASRFDGDPDLLVVEEGVHRIEISGGGNVLHTETLFVVRGETRTVTVNTGVR